VRTLPSNLGGDLYLVAQCFGPPGYACGPWGIYASIELQWAQLLLANNAQPTGARFGGSLIQTRAHGTAELAFTAADPGGPGVYQVTVLIDGRTAYQGTPNTNGGECAPAGTDPSTGALMFDYQQPCPPSESVDLPIPTDGLPDGDQLLQVVVTDAAQNSSTVLDRTITTANRTTVSAAGNASPANAPPASSAPTYAFRLDPLSERLASTIPHRGYRGSGLTLSGTVLAPSGSPAPGIAVIAQTGTLAGDSFATIAQSTADGRGHFTIHIPPGSSRLVRLAIGASAVVFKELVTPNLSLHAQSLSGGRLVFTGKLAIAPLGDPRPLIIIRDRTPAGWQPLAYLRVNQAGRFRYTYQASRLTVGYQFAFQAATPATADWGAAWSSIQYAQVQP
jgi:hypothetical protein